MYSGSLTSLSVNVKDNKSGSYFLEHLEAAWAGLAVPSSLKVKMGKVMARKSSIAF